MNNIGRMEASEYIRDSVEVARNSSANPSKDLNPAELKDIQREALKVFANSAQNVYCMA